MLGGTTSESVSPDAGGDGGLLAGLPVSALAAGVAEDFLAEAGNASGLLLEAAADGAGGKGGGPAGLPSADADAAASGGAFEAAAKPVF